jgi:hypothetical protein
MEAPPWDARIIAAELDFRTEHSNPLTRNSPCKGIPEPYWVILLKFGKKQRLEEFREDGLDAVMAPA